MDHYEPSSRSQRAYDRRPPPPSYHDAPPPPSGPRDMFQFRGAASARPSGGDNYRPAPRRDGFNFSAGNNAPSFAPTNNYPGARRPVKDARRGRGQGQRNMRSRGAPRRFGPKPAHERDLMRHQREPTPEQMEGMNEGRESRFKVLGDLSDSDSGSDDSAMDLEDESGHSTGTPAVDHSDESEDEHPRAKRARIIKTKSPQAEQVKPKWSNPDPYTVLPPPGESDAKKKDVVKLIRKAKVEAAKPVAAAAEGDDFISLNFDDDDDDDVEQSDSNEEGDVSLSASVLSHKSSFSHLDHLHPDRNIAPPAPPAEEPRDAKGSMFGRLDVWPPPADVHGDPSGRSQYHTGLQRQEAKDAAAPLRKDNGKKRKRRDDREVGSIVEEWITPPDTDPAPWFANKLQGARAEHWLHNEILDFHNYVKPRDFENQVREDLVSRMDRAVKGTFPSLNVRAFGSFASGLYLPTADMDLVACSTRFLEGGRAEISPTRNWIFKFAACLKRAGIAIESSVTVISNARVPLVKFVEKVTGLRVDVSFENDSGLLANNTFRLWKQQYPAMPVIVSLIKQFLVMRGFSEVFTGGLGGYTVICLTVTILRILEERNGRDWDAMQSLDTVLMTFLVHYGRDFDLGRDGIQMDPWSIITKSFWRASNGKTSKPDRLLIIDPNNYGNDISGGSAQVLKIFDKFADAFRELNICMSDAEDTHRESGDVVSILERVWGGNYALFDVQRDRLRTVWQQNMTSGNSLSAGNNNQGGGNEHGSNNNNSGGSGLGGGSQHSLGKPPPGNQANVKKKSKRSANGESKPNKKHKKETNADEGTKREPLHTQYEEVGKPSFDATGGAPASPLIDITMPKKNKKRSKKAQKAKDEKTVKTEKNRASSFKRDHPDIKNVPDRLDKKAFRRLTDKHGKGLQT